MEGWGNWARGMAAGLGLWGMMNFSLSWAEAASNASLPPRLRVVETGERTAAPLELLGGEAERVRVYPPLERGEAGDGAWEEPLRQGRVRLNARPDRGGYYWMETSWETADAVTTVTTAHYFSQPGPAPTRMLARPKHRLELIPHPLPRERQRYRGGEPWPFQVRFDGQPLSGGTVRLHIEGLPVAEFVADASGLATVHPPARAPKAAGEAASGRGPGNGPGSKGEGKGEGRKGGGGGLGNHSRHGPSSPFVLEAIHEREGKRFVTT
ncbi:MAG: hypothetical protein HQL51_16000, partial [Magnetococcales bacterium]|nr:hypothetical protein [Magnetococcales bacterium]